jgi:hypothetical protein
MENAPDSPENSRTEVAARIFVREEKGDFSDEYLGPLFQKGLANALSFHEGSVSGAKVGDLVLISDPINAGVPTGNTAVVQKNILIRSSTKAGGVLVDEVFGTLAWIFGGNEFGQSWA